MRKGLVLMAVGAAALLALGAAEESCTPAGTRTEYCETPGPVSRSGVSVGLGLTLFRFRDVEIGASFSFTIPFERSISFKHKCISWPCCLPQEMDTGGVARIPAEVCIFDPTHPLGGISREVWVTSLLIGEPVVVEESCPSPCPAGIDNACYVVQQLTAQLAGAEVSLDFGLRLGLASISGHVNLLERNPWYECLAICRNGEECYSPVIKAYPIEGVLVPAHVAGKDIEFSVDILDLDLPHDSLEVTAYAPGLQIDVAGPEEIEGEPWLRRFTVTVRDRGAPADGRIRIVVRDGCIRESGEGPEVQDVPYRIVYPPQIELIEGPSYSPELCGEKLRDPGYFLRYRVWDPNPGGYDMIVTVTGRGGEAYLGLTGGRWGTYFHGDEVLVRFCPRENAATGRVILEVRHKLYNLATRTVTDFALLELPNRPPRVSPQAKVIEVRGSGDGGRDPWDPIMVWEADPPCFVFEDPDGHPLSFSVSPVSEEGGSVSLTISHWKAPLVHARPGYTFRAVAEVEPGPAGGSTHREGQLLGQ